MKASINYLIFLTVACAHSVNAQVVTTVDSTLSTNELDEVVVEAQNQRAKAGELTFIPTKRQKEIAADGYDLLRQMAMPQISVNPFNDNVTTLTGGDVSTFINGMPANNLDVKNLRTKNVMRIEYLDYPSDPRFQGAEHVLNYIVQMPEWGGYTRLSAASSLLSNSTVNTNFFSKFSYKKMLYDLYLGWNYNNSHHTGYENKELFSLLTPEGEPFVLEQMQKTDYTRSRTSSIPVNFRTSYLSQNFQTQNSVYFSFSDMPDNTIKGALLVSPDFNRNYTFRNATGSNSRNVGWTGYYNLYLKHGVSFNLSTNFNYSNNHNNSLYTTSLFPANSAIITNSGEDAWGAGGSLSGRKQLSADHSIGASYFVNYSDYDIDYTGTTEYNVRMKCTNMGGSIEYTGYLPFGMRINGYAGIGWTKYDTNGRKNYSLYPTLRVSASYSPSQQHQLNLTARLTNIGSPASYKTTEILQSSDFLYKTGNPYLDAYNVLNCNFTYTWFASNKLNLGAFADVAISFNKMALIYSHHLDGQALLESYENNGNSYFGTLGITATYKPINSLQFELKGGYQPQKVTGTMKSKANLVSALLNATYYLGRFYISALGSLGGRSLNPFGTILHGKAAYSFRGGWGNGNWNVQLQANNIFNSSWNSYTADMIYPLYSSFKTDKSGMYHRNIVVSVSYTFDYGKKIKHANEIGANETNNSAVLK